MTPGREVMPVALSKTQTMVPREIYLRAAENCGVLMYLEAKERK